MHWLCAVSMLTALFVAKMKSISSWSLFPGHGELIDLLKIFTNLLLHFIAPNEGHILWMVAQALMKRAIDHQTSLPHHQATPKDCMIFAQFFFLLVPIQAKSRPAYINHLDCLSRAKHLKHSALECQNSFEWIRNPPSLDRTEVNPPHLRVYFYL